MKPNVGFSANQAAQTSTAETSAAAGGTSASTASSGCKGEGGSDCIFPFKYRGATFNNCKMSANWRPNSASGKYGWCATEVETEGKKAMVMKTQENCVKACKKLTRKRFFNLKRVKKDLEIKGPKFSPVLKLGLSDAGWLQ